MFPAILSGAGRAAERNVRLLKSGIPPGSTASAVARLRQKREEQLTITLWFLLLFTGVALLIMALAVPLMQGRVKPNSLYGLRTERTLRDADAWYRGNAYAGRLFVRTGMAVLVAVVGLYCVPSWRGNFVAYNITGGTVILGGVLFTTALALRFVRSL